MTNKEEYFDKQQHSSTNYPEENVAISGDKEAFSRKGISGLVFVGCLMLGLAFGYLFGNIVVGLFLGLGVGFFTMAVVRYVAGVW